MTEELYILYCDFLGLFLILKEERILTSLLKNDKELNLNSEFNNVSTSFSTRVFVDIV